MKDAESPDLVVTPALVLRAYAAGVFPMANSAEDDEIYRLTFPFMAVLPESQRMGCGDGVVIPPRNQWYLRRVKDVLAISNSKRPLKVGASGSGELMLLAVPRAWP